MMFNSSLGEQVIGSYAREPQALLKSECVRSAPGSNRASCLSMKLYGGAQRGAQIAFELYLPLTLRRSMPLWPAPCQEIAAEAEDLTQERF